MEAATFSVPAFVPVFYAYGVGTCLEHALPAAMKMLGE